MSEDSEGRVWVGPGRLGRILCPCLGGVGWVGVYLVCVPSLWLLHLAIPAPCREGEIPMGREEIKHAWLPRSETWG